MTRLWVSRRAIAGGRAALAEGRRVEVGEDVAAEGAKTREEGVAIGLRASRCSAGDGAGVRHYEECGMKWECGFRAASPRDLRSGIERIELSRKLRA